MPDSTSQPAAARFAASVDNVRGSRKRTRTRLAASLRLAVKALKTNIRKLERTGGAHPLLINARKKQLAKLEGELERNSRKMRKGD